MLRTESVNKKKNGFAILYEHPMRSTRNGPLFNAFPYPTKISPEVIALFIAAHTEPGETVFDGFAGSGSTGIASILCANPSEEMRQEAKRLGLNVRWGARKAILYELGVLGSFIAKTLCSPPNPNEFAQAAQQLLSDVEQQSGWLYNSIDPIGKVGNIRYIVWSDILHCPSCRKHVSFWDACVSREPANISRDFTCPHCEEIANLKDVQRIHKRSKDELLDKEIIMRHRKPVWVYGETAGKSWSRRVNQSDLHKLQQIDLEQIPDCVPKEAIAWGDLYRSGYHKGISHLHHFYTRRNLIVSGKLWSEVNNYPKHLRDALRFLLLSYNAAHSTIMTRVVAKKGQNDLVVTSAQPGVLYVSGLPVEKNIFAGIRRKLNTICRAFELTHGYPDLVDVRNESCSNVNIWNESIDYVFTDPPFGGNIPYAEINFINECWLGKITDQKEEAIISSHQGKTVDHYQILLQQAFREINRILCSDKNATIIFHSSSAKVWNALRNACEQAGLNVAVTSILDKTQSSFKQVTSPNAVKGDAVILLNKQPFKPNKFETELSLVITGLVKQAAHLDDPAEASPQRIYSRLVGHYLSANQDIPISANIFYKQFSERWTSESQAV